MTNYILKKLEIKDAIQVFEVIQSLRSPGVPHWTLAQVQDEIRGAESLAFLGGEHLCAFVLFQKVTLEQAEISYLASAPLFQKQGHMTKLLQELLGNLIRESVSELWLEVHEKNSNARALYEKLNFKQVGLRKRYYSDQGDAILYSLKLKP